MRTVAIVPTFDGWQAAARALLREGIAPGEVRWSETAPGEAPTDVVHDAGAPGAARVPRQFLDLARQVAAGRDPARWQVLYEVLWRLVNENRGLLGETHHPMVRRLNALAAAGRRDAFRTETEALTLEPEGAGAAPFVPAGAGLAELGAAAARCTGCDLYRHATQTVFGRGPADARIVLVGEQPGDQEDLKGAPFVGPAGEVLVCLGATAARAIFGPDFRLLRDRGRFSPTRWTEKTIATLHPSAVLRGEDPTQQARLYGTLVADLTLVAGA